MGPFKWQVTKKHYLIAISIIPISVLCADINCADIYLVKYYILIIKLQHCVTLYSSTS